MKSIQLRQHYLDFFKEKDHTIVPSMSLIPRDDPSLLFTSAGMVQFKPLWIGAVPLPYRRATSVQKCLRTSDLENVGKTRRHHTFFEMLGNFSFGDYFKDEAITWAWDYLTDVLKLDKDKLFVSVYNQDEEAYDLWHKKIGLNTARIFKFGDEDNFWGPAGNSGPCGPCSEIFYDLGEKFGCGKKTCAPGCDCDRFPEIWNLVFPQYDQQVSGERLPLKNRGVDTGMGFERLVAVLQNEDSIYATDLFSSIIEDIASLKKIHYGKNDAVDIPVNVIADHTRALVFAIADGIIPSNEERGYVLRRILRRAVRLSRNLGGEDAFLYRLVPRVIELYAGAYPEIKERREEITGVIKSEEERFLTTLEKGLQQFEEISRNKKDISGEDAFKLYDTYGFPFELTQEIAKEKGLKTDEQGFLSMLDRAREVSKTRAKFVPKGEWQVLKQGHGTFTGYDEKEVMTNILRYNAYDSIIEIVLEQSPFYAEAGGQVGERGELVGTDFALEVQDTYWYQGMIVCHCQIRSGEPIMLKKGTQVRARVDTVHRTESGRAHTATHLLHAALRKTLGEHARQEGSYVEPGRFRFDFTHFKPLSEDEIRAIEDMVIEKILEAIPVDKQWMSLDEAKKLGAMAIFGEKYGDRVRVVKIGDFSIELCGGIHLDNTGEIGLFKIISQEAAAAGIRRVEAFVGMRLFNYVRKHDTIMRDLARLTGREDTGIVRWVEETQQQLKKAEKIREQTLSELARSESAAFLATISKKKSLFVYRELKNFGSPGMRLVADIVRNKAKTVVGLLYENIGGRLSYLLFTGEDLLNRYPASKIIKEFGKIVGGGGGGRPHMAEGGGGNPAKLDEAISFLKKLVKPL
ncbi:MAG: alanine--tRNA ligase [candidate division WOR-3 bacterium]|nr:MAG: alanine--tRNA ligase [candidate division WOR-3 bacterium]